MENDHVSITVKIGNVTFYSPLALLGGFLYLLGRFKFRAVFFVLLNPCFGAGDLQRADMHPSLSLLTMYSVVWDTRKFVKETRPVCFDLLNLCFRVDAICLPYLSYYIS